MKIKKIIHQEKDQLKAAFECEHCKTEFVGAGMDNKDFYEVVPPNITCPECRLNSFKEPELIVNRKLCRILDLKLEQLFAYVEDYLKPKCCECDGVGIRKGRDGKIRCGLHHSDHVLKNNQDWG